MKGVAVVYEILTEKDVERLTDAQLESMNTVLSQLGSNVEKISKHYLLEVAQKSKVAVAWNCDTPAKIIGIGCLVPVTAITSRVGLLTHIVVEESMRRQGIAAELMNLLIQAARNLSLKRIDLTSQPSRTEAQKFWKKQGFKKRETNNFRLELM